MSMSAGVLTRQLAAVVFVLLSAALPVRAEEAATETSAIGEADARGAPGFATLYRFVGNKLGAFPRGGVAVDGKGNVYGTTQYDGLCTNCGVAWRWSPSSGTYTVLYRFGKNLQDGIRPLAPLTLGPDGTLYGTASAGADPTCGCGEVFSLTPNGAGKPWTYKILHRFTPREQGSTPIGGVLLDKDGTLYGATSAGGRSGAGLIYRLTKSGSFTILYQFPGNFNGGPEGELVFGPDGAIYGTQFGGGKHNQGTIFRITKQGGFSVLYDFRGLYTDINGHDGAQPEGRLVFLGKTLYGTTTFGGSPSGYGTIWSLNLAGGGKGVYKQLFILGSDGNLPHSGLVTDGKNLYGTGAGGGRWQGGVIYKLTAPATPSGSWRYSILQSFQARHKDGDIPYGVLLYRFGALWGTNISGGKLNSSSFVCRDGCGTLFRFGL